MPHLNTDQLDVDGEFLASTRFSIRSAALKSFDVIPVDTKIKWKQLRPTFLATRNWCVNYLAQITHD